MRKICLYTLPVSLLISFLSCHTTYQPASVQYMDYRIGGSAGADAALTALVKPYSDSVNKSMNDVIAVAGIELEKKQPEGTLGNLMADAMLAMARKKYNVPVDASFVNYVGIRLPSIPAGPITRGKIFELSPFDNIIVLLKLDGKILQQLLDHISSRKGWPAAGVSWQMKQSKAVNIKINGQELDPDKIYTIAILDYIANGGDDCNMLKSIPQTNNAILFRDAIIEYLSGIQQRGEKITANIENRVNNVQ